MTLSWKFDWDSSLKHDSEPITCQKIKNIFLPERTMVNALLHRCYVVRRESICIANRAGPLCNFFERGLLWHCGGVLAQRKHAMLNGLATGIHWCLQTNKTGRHWIFCVSGPSFWCTPACCLPANRDHPCCWVCVGAGYGAWPGCWRSNGEGLCGPVCYRLPSRGSCCHSACRGSGRGGDLAHDMVPDLNCWK